MTEVNYSKILLIFFLTVLGATILLGVISTVFQLSMTGATVAVPLIGAVFAGQSFIKKYQRAPNPDEVKRLTLLSFFYFIGLQVLFLILALANPELQSLFSKVNGIVIALTLFFLLFYFVIAYVFIRWGYGGLTQKFADKTLK